MRPFLVFKCSKCRNFTNAPVGQKRRRCSYCGKIIDISKAAKAVFDTPEQASAAVKSFNASRGGDEFNKAVERSRSRVLALMPPEEIRAQDIADDDEDIAPSQGKRRTLISILQKEASGKPCPLDKIEQACIDAGLEWNWVEKQFQGLANSGEIIFPRPWTIQYVSDKKPETKKQGSDRDVTLDILVLLGEAGGRMSLKEIVAHFKKRGISEGSVEISLEKLMRNGDIYEPLAGHVSLLE